MVSAASSPLPHTVLLLQSDAQVAARLQAVINEVPGLRVVGVMRASPSSTCAIVSMNSVTLPPCTK